MKLQGRNLSLRMTGTDVKLLHTELGILGVAIPDSESREAAFGPTTEAVVKTFQTAQGLPPTGIVDEPTAALINREVDRRAARFIVKGHIRDTAGQPFTYGAVKAFDKDLRSEGLLGEATPDARGYYEIRYSAEQFDRAEKQTADLIVRIYGADRAQLFSSEVIFNAAPAQTVDIVLDEAKRLSEFERHLAQIQPLLQGLAMADLKEADIDFLAQETGIEHVQVAFLVVAHQHALPTRIAPEIFYGLFRQDLPSNLPALLLKTPRALRAALVSSVEDALIPALDAAAIDAAIAALERQVSERLLRDPRGGEVAPRLLRAAGLSPEEQDAFLAAYLSHEGSIDAFWRAQRATPLAGKVQALQGTLQLGVVTLNNLPLIEALQTRNVRSPADIARLQRRELEEIISGSPDILAAIPADSITETAAQKAARTSDGIFEILHATRPTAFVRAAYDQATDPVRRDVARVLGNAPQLELRDAHIDDFLADNPGALASVTNPDTTKTHLRRVQRALRVAPHAEHAETLLAAGLDSAQAIVSMSPSAFAESFAGQLGGPAQAMQYHQKAKEVNAAVLAIAAAVKQSFAGNSPGVIQPVSESVKTLPNFTTLFGSQSACACGHCGSVLSPAAYLVELFDFLNPKFGSKPITRLRQKRPDLEHIQLTCENTNTPLPYVDLVNEVLEFYVANQSLSPAAAHDTAGMTAEELSVTPQYVIAAAYDTLAQAIYPPRLPLQRPLLLTRAHLTRLGASRHEVMRTFGADAAGSADTDLEYLGISTFERDILAGTSGRPLAEFYGYPPAQDPSAQIEIKVADFLQRTGLSFEELVALLATRFLNSDGAIQLVDDQNPPGCDLTKTTLGNLTPQFWHRAHRFVRLQRKLGWSIADLDLAARAFQSTDVTAELLRRLSFAQQLKAELQLPLDVLLSFWSDLDPAPDSLYAKLFLNKKLQNPPNPAFVPGTPESAAALLQEQLPTICAALRVSDEDLTALRAHLSLAEPQTALSVANLSALHRYAVLCRTLRFGVRDLLSFIALQASNPFIDAAATRQFIESARQIRASGFSVAQLDYLYRNASDPANPIAPSPESTLALLRELRTGLKAILAEGDDPQSAASLLLREDFVARSLSEPFGISQRAAHLLLQTQIEAFFSLAALVNDVDVPLPVATSNSLARLHKAALLVKGFGITDDELDYLIAHGADFDNLDFNALPLSTADFQPAQFAQWRRLAGLFALRNGLPPAQATLVDVFTAASSGAADARQQAIGALTAATEWPAREIDFLVSPQGFDLASADDFRNERQLLPLAARIELSRRLGIPSQRLMGWAGAEPDAAAAQELVGAVKARYTDEQWLAVAKPINDDLRDAQKSGLVAYVLANDPTVKQAGITDSNQLFEYFLIDVEMCSCMNTSRIKQAISSVQLFVQRCLMNLEAGVSPSTIDAERWQWMKNYRVWEANRKVFLYPENWIEPELRDGKSPFFEELENELLQNDITPAVAEQSFVHYLEKLDQVGRLEVCGLYVEEASGSGDGEIVHVFGRTKTIPRVYFYRRLLNGRSWTPWAKIDIDIEGDHLVPVVHNRRLYLFWPNFEEKQDEVQQLPHTYIQSREHWKWLNEDYPEWKSAHAKWSRQHEGWAFLNKLKADEEVGVSIPGMKEAIALVYEIDLDSEELSEPREPEEPAFSAPPPLTHRAIKLAWSEYRDGAWSGKHASAEWVKSPHVATSLQDVFAAAGPLGLLLQGAYIREYRIMPLSIGGGVDETIFSVYLPTAEEHFLRTSIDAATGDLKLKVFRRYSTIVPVLDAPPLEVKGYDSLGWFSLHCGNKVHARSELQGKDFKSLPRPRGTDNFAMSFQHPRDLTRKLTFNDDGNVQHILENLPGSGDFDLLYEHQRSKFRLKPPFQHFFYQDQFKTYFVSDDDEKLTLAIENPDFAQMAAAPMYDSPAVVAAKPKKRQLKGSTVQFQQSVSQAVSPVTTSADDDSFALATTTAPYATAGANQALQLLQEGAVVPAASHKGLRFEAFFHPHVCEFIERLYRSGVPALLSRDTQRLDKDGALPGRVFETLYDPSSLVDSTYPREHVDFEQGAYASYNWELFFHAPMLIATALTRSQRFEDALTWYHYIFNPTTSDGTPSLQRFWNTLPFFDNAHPEKEQIQHMLLTLAGKKPGWSKIQAQIEDWLADPFNPHLIARMRITAYQKNVVMKYIDNLIAWADQLFGRDTIESINEASLLYVLAYNILGPRPKTIVSHTTSEPKTYQQIAGDLDAFANALVDAENLVPYSANLSPSANGAPSSSAIQSLYFCIPQNAELLAYWDKVDDRLFKIRNCMSLDGVRRDLPLFEPPIDPALLVKARAAGVDLGSVLNELTAPLPHYRFNILLQKALEICGEVKALGGALLAALEKRDGEALSNLRTTQETALLKVISTVKRQQIDEAKASIEALRRTRRVTETRYNYYRDIDRISNHEQNYMDSLSLAHTFNLASQSAQAAASVAFQFPNTTLGISGAAGTPVSTYTLGGATVGAALQSAAAVVGMISSAYSHDANMASVIAGHDRRWQDWKLQESLANKELDQLDKQIAAAEIRQAITEKELENHQQQIENSVAVEQFMRGKFTNQDLYGWMITQLSKVYFQAYKLATDLAKRAERSFRHELGVPTSDFIQPGTWSTLKKGLLAGEQLALDLKRLDTAYLNQNKREYELTRHVSLLQVSPKALLELRATGLCTVKLPEELFDMDGPGHYFRRIKSVALTIPCVAGPYTSVNCTLTLLRSTVRREWLLSGGYARQGDGDVRFVDSLGAVQAMVTSTAQSDSGLFEANLRDERYLPFEYSGAESEWQLELPANPANGDPAQFDYDTIGDVILTLRYTAREGGAPLRQGALENLKAGLQNASLAGNARLFSVRHEFPTEWARFQGQVPGENQRFELSLNLRAEHYPFWSQGLLDTVARVEVLLRSTAEPAPANVTVFGTADQSAASQPQELLVTNPELGKVLAGQFSGGASGIALPETPITTLKLCFDERAMSDLWIAITWGGANG